MTPQDQSGADRLSLNIHFVANGYIVGYPTERRVYKTEAALFEDLQAYIVAYRSARPSKTSTPYCPAIEKKKAEGGE